jgi:hypothetical protein
VRGEPEPQGQGRCDRQYMPSVTEFPDTARSEHAAPVPEPSPVLTLETNDALAPALGQSLRRQPSGPKGLEHDVGEDLWG